MMGSRNWGPLCFRCSLQTKIELLVTHFRMRPHMTGPEIGSCMTPPVFRVCKQNEYAIHGIVQYLNTLTYQKCNTRALAEVLLTRLSPPVMTSATSSSLNGSPLCAKKQGTAPLRDRIAPSASPLGLLYLPLDFQGS